MAYWFLPYIIMNQPQVHVCPLPLGPPPSPPTPSTPLGCHRALGLSCLGYRAPSHWQSLLHMVMEMFQCSCLNASHPLLPPLCPQVSSLCLHLLMPYRQVHQYRHLSRFYTYALMQDMCSFLSDFLHSVLKALSSSTSLELSQMHSFLWLCVILFNWYKYWTISLPWGISTFWCWLIMFSLEM